MNILVDSSVWIALLRGADIPEVRRLRAIDEPDEILLGDMILFEVLQGARDDSHAEQIERHLRQFPVQPVLGEGIAVRAARNDRLLRARGVTVRKTIDVIIGAFCIEHGYALLHADRDFAPMAAHLGLREA